MRALAPLLVALTLAASGCGDDASDADRTARQAEGAEALPAPGRTGGSVTGMPGAGDPRRTLPPEETPEPPPDTAVDSEGNPLLPDGIAGIDPDLPGGVLPVPDAGIGADGASSPADPGTGLATADGPGPAEAIAVVKAYYESLNARSFGGAYRLWSGDGSASGQSPQQFADSFAQVAGMTVEIMEPGRIDAAAGSRYIEVPVAVKTTRADGSVHRYAGAYTLRRAVADGAGNEQRSWRIASADLREVQP